MLYALEQVDREKQKSPSATPTMPNMRPDLIELAAGYDEWPELLNYYGSPEVIEFLRVNEHPYVMERKSAKTT